MTKTSWWQLYCGVTDRVAFCRLCSHHTILFSYLPDWLTSYKLCLSLNWLMLWEKCGHCNSCNWRDDQHRIGSYTRQVTLQILLQVTCFWNYSDLPSTSRFLLTHFQLLALKMHLEGSGGHSLTHSVCIPVNKNNDLCITVFQQGILTAAGGTRQYNYQLCELLL